MKNKELLTMKAKFRHLLPTSLLALLGAAYAILFYHAEMGVNLLLFDAILITAALWSVPILLTSTSLL